MPRGFTPALLVLTITAGCGPTYVERPTQVRIDPASSDFFALPMPSDRRHGEDSRYGLAAWPGANAFMHIWLEAADHFLTEGWGVSTGVFVELTGAIDDATVPLDARASLGGEASVFLLDVDPDSSERGRRIPLNVSIAPADHLTPDNLLAAIPVFGFLRRPSTTYALVVTDRIRDADGERLGRSPAFHDSFEQLPGSDAQLRASYGLVRSTLADESYDLGSVIGAAVFTTMDPEAMLRDLAAWTEALPSPHLATPWQATEEYESYQVLVASYDSPNIQEGEPPYSRPGEGAIVRDANGDPVIQHTQQVRLALTIPKTPQPAAGFPLTLYLHGTGGEWYQAINRGPRPELPPDQQVVSTPGTGPAEWLARRGIATLGFDFPLHGNRNDPPDSEGMLFYNLFSNPAVTIYNFHIAVMELLRLSRLAVSMSVDASLSPNLDAGARSDGRIGFDRSRLTAMGQSMGTTLGIPWAGIDPRLKGAVFSGTGGMLVEIGTSAKEPIRVNELFSALSGYDGGVVGFHRAHPLLHALQNFWDLIDPVVKARRVISEPLSGMHPKDVLMTAGFRDGYFHPNAQAAVAVPLGVPLVGNAVEPILPDALDLAGRDRIGYPVHRNLAGSTGAVIQYTAPYSLGHYVVFNQNGARYQYTCFLASVGAPRTAGSSGGAVIPAPYAGPDFADAACP